MGTGWRRAFCTSIPRDPEDAANRDKLHRRQRQCSPTSSPASCAKFGGVFSGGRSNNTSPTRLRCRAPSTPTDAAEDAANTYRCRNTSFAGPYTPPPPSSVGVKGSPRLLLTSSNPASPRSPFRFSLLKATLRLSRSRCGVCSQSVSTDQRTAVFTAECSHSFHFHCISAHFRSQSRSQSSCLTCPVCSASWHEVPLLSQANTLAVTPPPASKGKVSSDKPGEKELKQGKIYDDDEPLQISSTAHGGGALHFNPIPEAELEDELEGGSTHVGGSSSQATGFGVEVSVMPEAAVVSYDRANSQYVVLVRVRAPSPPNRSVSKVAASLMDPSCRAPIDLVTVLDVSGSMTAAKLQMLKHAMRLLISSLGPTDRLSIVAFSAGAKRLLPLIRMSRAGQRSARQIIERLIISGSSGEDGICIGHALRKATKVLEDRRQRNPVATIMLLSNGHQKEQPLQEDTSDPSQEFLHP
ncbi:hypothetical protein HPP92_012299 [Vanilla planifolia]|uniref:Uncharacterized protein n=1 Tax=Vanilla planifolia TaxID=51239 RepID=A0A835UYX2_VANPL|nr:hypothetical protein HPP92_012299 [Vanilla planifolia]